MYSFSKAGIKNVDVYNVAYKDFINWCKSYVKCGMFSTYCDGEPVCLAGGLEISYSMYLNSQKLN